MSTASEGTDARERLVAWGRAARAPAWAGYACFSAAYLLASWLGHLLLDRVTGMAVVWPAAGVYLVALLLAPSRRWPLVALAALPASLAPSLLHGRAPALSLALFAGNTLEAVAGAWLVRRAAGPSPSPATVRGAVALATAPAAAGAAISLGASVGLSLTTGGRLSGAVWVFWGGASLGALLVAPLVLAWAASPRAPRRPPRLADAVEIVALAAAIALAVFALSRAGEVPWAHEVLLIPPLLWAALRFGARGATLAVAAAALAVARLHAAGAMALHGTASVPAAQFFLAVVATTVLVVAAASEERRRAAQELARSRDLLESFFASSPTAMFIKDEAHRAVVLSGHFLQMLGVPPSELLGKTVEETIPGPLGAELLEMERAALSAGAPVRREIRFGDRTFVDLAFPIPRADGPPFIGGFALDVTDRVRAEAALRAGEAQLRVVEAALDRTSDAVTVVDREGQIVWVNEAHARGVRQPKERLVGARIFDVDRDVDPASWGRAFEEVAAQDVLVREEPIRAPDGRSVPGEVAAAVIELDGRRYLVRSARDVSDRRRAEAAARLAGIGTLAAGVAHEINNPLAYVISNLGWLGEQLERAPDHAATREETRRVIAEAQDGAARVREIVQHLRLFARPDERLGAVDVRDAIRSAATLAQNQIRHHATLVLRLGDVPLVVGNENRLAQVFLNLLTNAAQAIPAGRADANAIVVETCTAPDGRVVAEVCDTGTGISPEARAHVFEPFFTTKPVGGGTGLGLFICHGIVTGMGGRIEVESERGAGALFRVVLPPAPRARVKSAPPAPAEAPSAPCRASVLVLDDDERVASALRRTLARDHDVEIATDARAALERVRAGHEWDVVFCDLMMPDMTGMEWFEHVSSVSPALASRVVFITGGAFTDAAREFLGRVPNLRVEKPFSPDEVRALVAARGATGGVPRHPPGSARRG